MSISQLAVTGTLYVQVALLPSKLLTPPCGARLSDGRNANWAARKLVGSWSLIKSGCRTGKDIPPYILAAHNPITYKGIDAFIMRRSGFSEEAIENIALAYRQIYSSGTSLENAVLRIKDVCTPSPEIDYILRFIEESKMGIIATYGEEGL